MGSKGILFLTVLGIYISIQGAIELSCETQRPFSDSNVTCTCDSSNAIDWIVGNDTIQSCLASGICFPSSPPSGYSVSNDVTGPSKEYNLTMLSFSYTKCLRYSCKDTVTTEERGIDLIIADFDSSVPVAIDEPTAGEGNIEITTACLFKVSDIVSTWYTVKEGEEKPYPEKTYSTPSDCSETCDGESAVTLTVGFNYSEPTGNTESVQFRIKVFHKEDPNPKNVLVLTTVKFYSIPVENEPFPCWGIALIVIGGLYLCGIVIGIFMYCCKDEPWNKINVEDKTYWWIFLLIIVIAGLGILTVYLICKGCGRFNEKQQPCETERGERKKDSQKKKKGDTQNRTPRPQPTPPVKPLETREESGSAVSRKDVDIQDHSNNLHKRPIPEIALSKGKEHDFIGHHYNVHDNKGRGLSANFDDDYHPMTTVGIPGKKAGALEPLDEAAGDQAPKKLKKKKKKRLEDDDQF